MRRALILAFLCSFIPLTNSTVAQDAGISDKDRAPGPIQDNSFLIEEAYNQEDGVVQHISNFERLANSRDWIYTQTDEWPLRNFKHQLSLTLMGTHAGSFEGSGAGWGDTAINYRYQLVGTGETKLAVAPRLTLLVPTGNHRFGRGSGGLGVQTNLPISIQHSAHFVTHWNAGATWIPHALDERGDAAGTTGINLGQSMVWLATPRVNFLVETLWIGSERVIAPDETERSEDSVREPGDAVGAQSEQWIADCSRLRVPYGNRSECGREGDYFLSELRASLKLCALQSKVTAESTCRLASTGFPADRTKS